MAVSARSIGEAFVSIAGRDRVRDDTAALAAATVDGVQPRWAVRPASLEQLSRILALACDGRLAVVPRGAGSSQELGHPLSRVDVVLDLTGLDQVIEYNPDDLTVTVQAGVSSGAPAPRLSPRPPPLARDPPGGPPPPPARIPATTADGPARRP